MENNLMNIVLVANDNYMEHLAVTMVSILLNAKKNDSFKFYILSNDISKKSKKRLLKLRFYKNFEIEFLNIPEETFNRLPENAHLKRQTYYRFLMPQLINEKKVLYLDCDVIVRKSLKDFYQIDFDNNYAIVIEDMTYGKSTNSTKIIKAHNIDNYFNAGILLLNLEKIKADKIMEACFDFCIKNPEKLFFCDQDALNCVLHKQVKFINCIYNFQYSIHVENIKKIYKNLKKEIKIIHFVSAQKPWNFLPRLDFGIEYYKYALLTPWFFNATKNIFIFLIEKIKTNIYKTLIALKTL